MTLPFALVLICFGVAAADVAHLVRSYLPPARLMALPVTQNGFSAGSRTSSFSAGAGFSDRLTAAVPAANYIAPASANYQSTNFISAPARLTAPAPQNFISSESQRLIALPQQSFVVPSSAQKYIAPAAQNLISTEAQRFVAPAPGACCSSSAPSAPVAAAFTAKQFGSAQLALPSREFSTSEVETFEPLVVKQSYTAPAITYSAPASSAASSAFTAGSANLETQYSADGGYVY